MKRNIKKILSALAAMLLLMAPATANAADDFVDQINSNLQGYAAGQRVIYELNVGSFTQEGTFRAAQSKLQDLKSLGVDIVWLMPIYPRGGGQNSPYAATNFKAVNPAYGTIDNLRAFVTAAHGLGMEVWLDWVPNHTATDNIWVSSHPEYYKKNANGGFVHPGSGPITYNDVYQLDYSNPDLCNAMNDCLKFWIDQADIDGYRCDMVSSSEIPASYWQAAIPLIKNYKAGKTISFLAEDDMSNASEFSKRSVGFDYDYAWNFQESNLQNGFGSSNDAKTLKNYVQQFYNNSRNLGVGRMVYLTNHDQEWNGEKKTLSQKYGANKYLLTVLTYTVYGLPMIYNGEELGGEQALNYFEDTKIDWNQSDSKMLNTLRTLASIKHSQAALKDGKTPSDNGTFTILTTNNDNNILAYKRTSGTTEVVVLLNTATTPQDVTVQGVNGTYSLWLNSATIANGTSRKSYNFTNNLTQQVPAKGYLVFVKGDYPDEDNVDDHIPVITNLTDDSPTAIFYESDLSGASVHAWFWNGTHGGEQYTANGTGWPGDALNEIGKTPEGRYIYKLAFNVKEGLPLPSTLIITENGSDDANKTVNNAAFVNHGYYIKGNNVSAKTVPTATTGISAVSENVAADGGNDRYYDLAGRQIPKPASGFFIHNGKKYVR